MHVVADPLKCHQDVPELKELSTALPDRATFIIIVIIIIIIIIIIIGSTAQCGPWPSFSSDFATNNFSGLSCLLCVNPQQSWRIDVFLSGFSALADRSPF
jgi:hypothetical protein